MLFGELFYIEEGGLMLYFVLVVKNVGVVGICVNFVWDIKEIKEKVFLLIIGIIKRDYFFEELFIIVIMREVDELVVIGVEVIVLDCILCKCYDGLFINIFIEKVKKKYF